MRGGRGRLRARGPVMKNSSVVKLVAALVLAGLLLVLLLQNTTTVEVKLLFWTITGPLVILAIVVGALGFLLGLLVSRIASNRRRT
jgi:uncharacterized integral membrane protein